jgi:hypothetical protein
MWKSGVFLLLFTPRGGAQRGMMLSDPSYCVHWAAALLAMAGGKTLAMFVVACVDDCLNLMLHARSASRQATGHSSVTIL